MVIIPQNTSFLTGDVVYEQPSRLGPRVQRHLQLVYVFTGRLRVEVDGQARELGPREATLLLPGHRELFEFSPGGGATRHGWTQAHDVAFEGAALRLLEGLPPVQPLSARLETLHGLALELWRRGDAPARALHEPLARAILQEPLYLAGRPAGDTAPLPPALLRARATMEARLAEPLDLAALARAAHLSKAQLLRLFRRHLGRTPMALLWELRVRRGLELLRATGLSVAEVAERSGFKTPYHFSRLVKQHTGLPPRAYRRREWQGGRDG